MLAQVEAGKAEGLLAWHPDRLARNSVDGGRVIYLLDTGKLTDLRFPTYRLDNTAQGKFMLSIAFGQSKYYVDNLSENVKRGLRAKLRRGEWPGPAPLGYATDYRTHTVAPHPEKAALVRKLFELYATGDYSVTEVYREAVRWGLTGTTGKPVYKSGVAFALSNPFYFGLMRWKGETYEGSHPPLISKQLFDRVQEALTLQAKVVKKGVVKYHFSGLMRCGECGCMITAERQKGHVYYRCTKKKRGASCTQRFLREEALLAQIRQALLKVALDRESADKIVALWEAEEGAASNASLAYSRQIAGQLQAVDAKLERLVDLHISREVTQEEYQRKRAKMLGEKLELKEKLAGLEKEGGGWLEPAKAFLSQCIAIGSVAGQENPAAQRAFLRTVGSNLSLSNRTLCFSYKLPFSFLAENDSRPKWLPGQDSNLGHADYDLPSLPRG
jgi:DNA invertase Pin-like site-specific DNA recombinase